MLFGFAAYFGYKKLAVQNMEPLQGFPEETAVIFEIPDARFLYSKLKDGNLFMADLLQEESVVDLDSVFKILILQSENTEQLKSFLSATFYLSFLEKNSKFHFLLIAKQNETNISELKELILPYFESLKFSSVPNNDKIVSFVSPSSTNFLAQENGLIFLSSSLPLIEESLNDLNKPKTFIKSSDFNALKKTQGKRADVYVYVNFDYADTVFSAQLKPTVKNQLKASKVANFSVLDLLVKKDELLISGYTTAYDTLDQFLAAFKNQKGKKSELTYSMPYTTESFISVNLSDYKSFAEKQTSWDYRTSIDKMILGKSMKITEQWWAGEMALVIDEKQKEYAIFTAKSGSEAFRILAEIAHQSQPAIVTETYRDLKIKQINSPVFLQSQFGSLFANFGAVYFCVIDETVVFGKKLSDMQRYIDALLLGNNLSKNEDYIAFSDNLSEDALIRVYSRNIQQNHPIIQLFAQETIGHLSGFKSLRDHIQSIGIQISNKNNLYYTGIFIKHGIKQTKKPSAWQVDLEAPIVAGPFLVKNHNTEGNSILVQDAFNTLYFLNAKGDIVWTQQLKEKMVSAVFEMDVYKNNKWQYIFNTANFIYLFDITGNTVPNYPIQLNSEASNGLQIIDYDNNKNYSLFLAGKNGELYNYELNGRLLKSWQAENTRKEIVKPLTHIVANKKDYLIFEAKNGDIIFTDRRGNKRMEIRQSFSNALGSDIYLNRTNSSKGIFLTTDADGAIVYIPETGKINKTSFGKFSPNHFFLYADFDGSLISDFIFLDDKKLRVFDNYKNVLLSYDFLNTIDLKPQLNMLNNQLIIGIVDRISKQLYLFNKDGLMNDKLFKGNTHFEIGNLRDQISTSLIIGLDNSVYNYPLD
jgi:hypothetical protein